MTRSEFILVTALVLFAAFALGWFAHWLLHRFTRLGDREMGEVDRLAQALHEAEEMRDQAITYLQQRESELTGELAQAHAELNAAMDGLRAAREHAARLQQRLDERA